MRIGFQKNETIMMKFLDFIGVQKRNTPAGEADQKLSFRPQILNPIENYDIDYHLSHDCQ